MTKNPLIQPFEGQGFDCSNGLPVQILAQSSAGEFDSEGFNAKYSLTSNVKAGNLLNSQTMSLKELLDIGMIPFDESITDANTEIIQSTLNLGIYKGDKDKKAEFNRNVHITIKKDGKELNCQTAPDKKESRGEGVESGNNVPKGDPTSLD